MNDDMFRMLELSQRGLNCSQILMHMRLESIGVKDSLLVQVMAGLGGGVGFCGKTCGALTGGACVLSLYTDSDATGETGVNPKGDGEESTPSQVTSLVMIGELVDWFEQEVGGLYGGVNCAEILGDTSGGRMAPATCARILSETHRKIDEILEAHNSEIVGPGDV